LNYCLQNRNKGGFLRSSSGKPFDPNDFKALVASKDEKQIKSLVDKIFTSVDTNSSGLWEFEELKTMLMQLNRSQNGRPNDEFGARQIFNKIDTDCDGTISK